MSSLRFEGRRARRYSVAFAGAATAWFGMFACAVASSALDPAASGLPSAPPLAVDRVFVDASETIMARVGQTFLIALDANRSTGFGWQSAVAPEPAVRALGAAYEVARSGLPGAGGRDILIFQAAAAGTANLTLEYVRPFDKSSIDNAKRVTFHVEIAP